MSLTLCCCFPCRCCGEEDTEVPTQSGPGSFGNTLRNYFRGPRGQEGVNGATAMTDGHLSPSEPQRGATHQEPPELILTFEQNLEKHQFFEASYQLKEREERVFRETTEADGLRHHEEEVNNLAADHTKLESHILKTLQQSLSLNTGEIGTEALKSAVKAIYQEEEQDQLWKQRGGTSLDWRPRSLKELHDKTLRSLVKDRMDNPLPTAVLDNQKQQSPFQIEICSMGRQLKEDLLLVVGVVKPCYPPEVDICNLYARLYHQVFSDRLREKVDVKEDKDYTSLLLWVNSYYPGLLHKPELATDINAEALGKLLPQQLLEPLEDRYLSKEQSEMMTYISRILEEEIQKWDNGEEPENVDGCYVSPVAFDIIPLIHDKVTSAKVVVGDLHKAQRLTGQLNDFMQRFKISQDKVIKRNKPNSKAIIKANLDCVEQFSDFLSKKGDLFPEDMRKNWLHVLKDMKESAHMYLLNPVHQVLKPQYRKLGTSDWLNKNLFEMLLDSIEREIQGLRGSKESCHQKLICQFYQEVTVEYVRRLLKGKVKLKDKQQQNKAYVTVKDDAEHLHNLFIQMGSNDDWLKEILTTIAEVLKLQDLPAIQMQVVSLGLTYPDLSEKHVSALLKLKTNITKADRRNVKETLTETLTEASVADARPFFSKVKVK